MSHATVVLLLAFFGIPELLGVDNANDLWGISWHHLHATSVIPVWPKN